MCDNRSIALTTPQAGLRRCHTDRLFSGDQLLDVISVGSVAAEFLLVKQALDPASQDNSEVCSAPFQNCGFKMRIPFAGAAASSFRYTPTLPDFVSEPHLQDTRGPTQSIARVGSTI